MPQGICPAVIRSPGDVSSFKGFHIGKVFVPNPLILAPMAGITDVVFRSIMKRMGAGLVYSEMISCQGIHYRNAKTMGFLDISPEERPVAMQIFGSDPGMMAEAGRIAESVGADMVDINLGCSVPKVARSGGGAGLCRDLKNLERVLSAVVRAVSIPVTIKIRIGWTLQEITAPEICRMAQELGISAIALHGRTSSQKYSGTADWDFIKKMRERVKIPFFGNGDINTPEKALERLENSACDGVMIGRATYHNPWIFRQILSLLENPQNPPPPPSPTDTGALLLEHLERAMERQGEISAVRSMRKFGAWYTRGLRNSSRFRERIFQAETGDDMAGMIREFFIDQRYSEDRI